MPQNLSLTNEQLRGLVLRSLKDCPQEQMNTLVMQVAIHASKIPGVSVNKQSSGHFFLTDHDKLRVHDIFYDLTYEGILRPGMDGANDKLPFYHLTEWGQKVVDDGQSQPFDPDGYLQRIRNDTSRIDPVIITYLSEALHTFRIGCLLASTVALGCASEKAVLLLINSYATRLPQARKETFLKTMDVRSIKKQFEKFSDRLDADIKPKLTGSVKDTLDVYVSGIFSMIRQMRNDAGHPTGIAITREEANANLTIFPVYLKHCYELMAEIDKMTF